MRGISSSSSDGPLIGLIRHLHHRRHRLRAQRGGVQRRDRRRYPGRHHLGRRNQSIAAKSLGMGPTLGRIGGRFGPSCERSACLTSTPCNELIARSGQNLGCRSYRSSSPYSRRTTLSATPLFRFRAEKPVQHLRSQPAAEFGPRPPVTTERPLRDRGGQCDPFGAGGTVPGLPRAEAAAPRRDGAEHRVLGRGPIYPHQAHEAARRLLIGVGLGGQVWGQQIECAAGEAEAASTP